MELNNFVGLLWGSKLVLSGMIGIRTGVFFTFFCFDFRKWSEIGAVSSALAGWFSWFYMYPVVSGSSSCEVDDEFLKKPPFDFIWSIETKIGAVIISGNYYNWLILWKYNQSANRFDWQKIKPITFLYR
jgi:hypothetical protein